MNRRDQLETFVNELTRLHVRAHQLGLREVGDMLHAALMQAEHESAAARLTSTPRRP